MIVEVMMKNSGFSGVNPLNQSCEDVWVVIIEVDVQAFKDTMSARVTMVVERSHRNREKRSDSC